jgi:hypothetical protein
MYLRTYVTLHWHYLYIFRDIDYCTLLSFVYFRDISYGTVLPLRMGGGTLASKLTLWSYFCAELVKKFTACMKSEDP